MDAVENKRISLPEERKRGKRRKRGERVSVVPWSTFFLLFFGWGELLRVGDGGGWGGSGDFTPAGSGSVLNVGSKPVYCRKVQTQVVRNS